jgi:hypothetical protein
MQIPKENILASAGKRLSNGNIELFTLLLHIQDQSDYKKVIRLIIIHLQSLTGSLHQ